MIGLASMRCTVQIAVRLVGGTQRDRSSVRVGSKEGDYEDEKATEHVIKYTKSLNNTPHSYRLSFACGLAILNSMDKHRRQLEPHELQEEYDADHKRGYIAYIGGEPITDGNGTTAWRDGWLQAREDLRKSTSPTQQPAV